MMALIQTDVEIGEILTRAFILRRVELIAAGVGDIVLVGSTNSASTLSSFYWASKVKSFAYCSSCCNI
jgi:hypothetical protein